jgi:hypothetical protein
MRDKFERVYAIRHMSGTDEDIQSIRNLRDGSSYSDQHLEDCWYMWRISWAVML